MKSEHKTSSSLEPALVSLAVAIVITLMAFMAALPAHRGARCPSAPPCEATEGPDFYSLPVVAVAFASRLDSAVEVGIGVEQAPFAQR